MSALCPLPSAPDPCPSLFPPAPLPLPPAPALPQPCPSPGLCGNFNGQEGDDFLTAGGLVEATGAGFANTWKAQSSCHDKQDWLDDPCSLNIESGERPPPPSCGSWRTLCVWEGRGLPCSGQPSAGSFCRGRFMVAQGGSRQATGRGAGPLIAGRWPSSRAGLSRDSAPPPPRRPTTRGGGEGAGAPCLVLG